MPYARQPSVVKSVRLGFILTSLFWVTGCSPKEKKAEKQHVSQQSNPESAAVPKNGNLIVDSVFAAALNGKLELVKSALEQGFKVDHPDPEGRTALMLAAFNGHTEIARLLLSKGAMIDIQDTKDGSTALMFAASGPFLETVKLLVEAGAKIDMADGNKRFTPLMWAAEEGHIKNVEYLLSKGANPSLKDIDGQTAETFAVRFNHGEIVKILQTASSKK